MDQRLTIPQALQLAADHHRAGRLREAETLYRQILRLDPNQPDALFLLGTLAGQMNQLPLAISLVERAAALRPNDSVFLANLGEFHRRLGHFDRAIGLLRRSIELFPTHPLSHSNLGFALAQTGHNDQAIAACNEAIRLQPAFVDAFINLAFAQHNKANLPAAVEAYQRAIALDPARQDAHYQMGLALTLAARFDEAIAAFKRALELKVDHVDAWSDLGVALLGARRLDESAAACQRALQIDPNFAGAHNNLGMVQAWTGQMTAAIAEFRRALPSNRPSLHSNLVYYLQFHPDCDPAQILLELKRWDQTHAAPLAAEIRPHPKPAAHSRERRLKIGYVSPNFREHVVGRNILPLLREHDRSQFEIFAFAGNFNQDAMTDRLRSHCDHWRPTAAMNDRQIAQLIREDAIDILIDLELHLAENRLLVFAQKPAPVQATFAGYPGGTGLSTMDYRLSDPYLDPEGADAFYVEKTIRLPHSFWCYDRQGMELDASPPVNPLPALTAGHLTFGCLNHVTKLSDASIELWRKVLDAVPNSRLVLFSLSDSHRHRLSEALGGRADFLYTLPRHEYMATYNQFDIALDTIPYNGHTTSLDSYWMGVPVVTLVGRTAVGRAGWSQLSNLKLTELAAHSPDEFVRIAASLAADLPRLRELRASLRQRMIDSPLMDAPGFARAIEAAYRRMWDSWINQ